MKKAVAYSRVSTEEQKKKGYSIDAQVDLCVEFAVRNNYQVVEIFKEEGKSAKNLCRPQLQAMFKYIKKNYKNIDALIFWKWDRLSRGEDEDYVELNKMFKKYEILPLSTEENNDTTPEAKLMRKITRATSSYELDKDSQRTKLGMRKKAALGFFPGKAPIGYLNKKDENDKGYIDADPIKAPYIKRIFKYYNSGMYSLERLGEKMFAEGFKDKYGKPYRARKFEEILKNIFYIGKFMWNGEPYDGKHKPIIDKKLFYNVQSKFENTNKPNRNDKKYIYSKFIKCAKCGCYLTAETQRGGHNSGEYVYYHCTNKKKIHPGLKGLSVRSDALDEAFQEILSNIEIPDVVVRMFKERITASLDELFKVENLLLKQQTEKIKELKFFIDEAYKDWKRDKMTEEEYIERKSTWQKELDLLLIEIKNGNNINQNVYKNIDLILKFCNRIPDLFLKASVDEKRMLLRMIIEEIQYADGEITLTLKPIFNALKLIKESETKWNDSEKVRTLKKPTETAILEFLNNKVTSAINSKVRTLKTLIIPNKKDPEGSNLLNGAGDGIRTHAYRNHNPRS